MFFGLGTFGQYPFGGGPTGAATTTNIAWFEPLSEPTRIKQGLKASQQQFIAWQPAPSPFVATGWFEPLSEPPRKKRGLPASEQQFISWQPAPSPFVATGWFEPLSEPTRKLPRNPSAYPPFSAWQPAPDPFVATGWFEPLSEPTRTLPGLKAALQQFIAWPPQLRPTPTVTVTMDAFETGDSMAASVQAWNVPASAEIGLVGAPGFAAEIAVVYGRQSGTVASVSISIRIV